jgi:hypothetical protein
VTWKTAGQLVRETVARLERKGLGAVADAAPSQARAGGLSAGQTVGGGPRVDLVIVHDCGPHRRAAACDLHDGQRSGE